MKKAFMLALALAASSSLAAPFVYPAGWTASKPGDVQTGGTLRVGGFRDPDTLNPFIDNTSESVITFLQAGGLIARDPLKDGDWVPYMAESYTVSPDKTTFTYKIRKGMKWSDGQAITADDWITTWKICISEPVKSTCNENFSINGKPVTLTKIDDYTLRFKLPKPDVEAFGITAFAPLPDHIFGPVFKKNPADVRDMWTVATDPKNMVWSGPFVLDKYVRGERAMLKKNPYFGEWNKDSAGKALPYLDGIQYNINQSQNAILASFVAGNIDTYSPLTRDDLAQVAEAIRNKKIDATLKANLSPASAGPDYLVFNWNKSADPFKQKLFQSAKFRQAMSMLMNRDAVVDLVLGGLGVPAYTGVYPIHKAWQAVGVDKYKFNPAAATKSLAELGFTKKDKDGYLVDNAGKRLEFSVETNAGNARREQTAKLFADEAKKVGVKVNVQLIDFNKVLEHMDAQGGNRPFDAIILGFGGGGLDFPVSGQNVVECATGENNHVYNQSGKCMFAWETQQVNLYWKGRSEFDINKRKAIANQIQKIEADNLGFIYIAGRGAHYAWSNKIEGEMPSNIASALWSTNLFGPRYAELTWIRK